MRYKTTNTDASDSFRRKSPFWESRQYYVTLILLPYMEERKQKNNKILHFYAKIAVFLPQNVTKQGTRAGALQN